jgi:hypothetical protein
MNERAREARFQIRQIDRRLAFLSKKLQRLEPINPISAESWQAAWDKHPDQHEERIIWLGRRATLRKELGAAIPEGDLCDLSARLECGETVSVQGRYCPCRFEMKIIEGALGTRWLTAVVNGKRVPNQNVLWGSHSARAWMRAVRIAISTDAGAIA